MCILDIFFPLATQKAQNLQTEQCMKEQWFWLQRLTLKYIIATKCLQTAL